MKHSSTGQHPWRSNTLLVGAVVVLLSGCAAAPIPAPSTPAARPTVAPSPAPTLHPDGTASENLPYFTTVVDQAWAGPSKASSIAYVDALTTAGFARADMQMTADTSTVGNPAESIQFSVRWGQTECLVGQVGPSTGNPVTTVLPQLPDGRCLIGATSPIEGAKK